MPRVWALTVLVLLLSSGAVGARQPGVRASIPLPAPAAALAESLGLPVADRSRIVLDIVRLIFDTPDGLDPKDVQLRARLNGLIESSASGETAPLPLDPSIWRETILKRDVPDARLFAAILSDSRTALLYHGLASLNDETLGWLGTEREVIEHLHAHAGAFASGAGGLRVKAGRVLVPGGPEADAIWESVIGAPPSRPADFVRRLFGSSEGRLAFFFETIAYLDEPRRMFALAEGRPSNARAAHVRSLARVFERSSGELRPAERPFARHPVDPALILSALIVTPDGRLSGPTGKRLWETVFRIDDGVEPQFAEVQDRVPKEPGTAEMDAAWLTSRIHAEGSSSARRRLDTFLFAQRVFRDHDAGSGAALATALRGVLAFPAMMLTLERCGVTSPEVLATAAVRANALNGIGDTAQRKNSIRLFQASMGIVDRAAVMGGLKPAPAAASLSSLLALDLSRADAGRQVATWLRTNLLPAMAVNGNVDSPEAVILASLAGANIPHVNDPVLEWEGLRYRVSPPLAELARLGRVRAQQGGASLDEVLTSGSSASEPGNGRQRNAADAVAIADVLTSILYAAHLGNPDSRLLAADNVALRHDLAFDSGTRTRPLLAWRPAVETFGEATGWRLSGSLLGLDVPLSRFALRRLDLTRMPPAPRLTTSERQTGALTVALMRANTLTDDVRDEIAAAITRGRARFAALATDPGEIEQVARDAGLSAWRRESLAWALRNDPAQVDSHFSLVELMWLGSPRLPGEASLDDWGAASFPVTGCLCLEMPRRGPWEFLGGRPSLGLLASRGADVALLIAEEFSALRLPAALAPAVLSFAMQDVLDATQPAYFDDWSEFGRATRTISKEQLIDYVAALTSGGPLLPVETDRN